MIKQYFTQAWAQLRQQPLISAVSIAGTALAISNSRIDLKDVSLTNHGGKDTLVIKDKKIIIAK